MDQIPKGFTLLLVQIARGLGLLTLGGYVTLILFAFQLVDKEAAAPLMALFAGAKLLHDFLINVRRWVDHTAFLHVGPFDVSLSFLAAALLLGSVTLQVWG